VPPEADAVVVYDIGPCLSQASVVQLGQSRSHLNLLSAFLSFKVAAAALRRGLKSVALLSPPQRQSEVLRLLAEECRPPDRPRPSTFGRLERGGGGDCVVLDLAYSDPLGDRDCPLLTDFLDGTMWLLNEAFKHARGKLLVIANVGFIRRNFSVGSGVRCFLDNLERDGAAIKPFPLESLRPGGQPETPGISYHRDPNEACVAILEDLSQARGGVVWNWPTSIEGLFKDKFIRALPSSAECVVAARISPAERGSLSTTGARIVDPPVVPDNLLYIENEVFWFLGRGFDGAAKQPYVRVTGGRAPFVLAKLSGLNDLIPSKTRWIPLVQSPAPTNGPLTDAEVAELKELQVEWNEVSLSGKPISVDNIQRYLHLNDRLSSCRTALSAPIPPPPMQIRPTSDRSRTKAKMALTDAELKELKVLQAEWNEVCISGKPIAAEKIQRYLYLNDRLSASRTELR